MDIEKSWNKALKHTEIIRARVQGLKTGAHTIVPYILLCESSINVGDTVVRKGQVVVGKPALFVPPNNPQFQGFDFEEEQGIDENSLINFLLVRGVTLPSLKYDNKTSSLDVFEGKLSKAIKHYEELLQQQENVQTGLMAGPEDCWQFSVLIFICGQITKNLDTDIHKLFEKYKQNREE